jgi:hypothetical protein
MGKRGPKSMAEMMAMSSLRRVSDTDRGWSADDLPSPPDHLQPSTKEWWIQVLRNSGIEQHKLRALQVAAEAFDRKEQARISVEKYGLVYIDPKGMIRARPEVAIERDSRIAFLRALRDLDLEVDLPAELEPRALFRR